MHASFFALALSSALAGANFTTGPNWQTDYTKARSLAAEVDKPMAVFLAPGKDPAKVVTGTIAEAVRDRLDSEYVCVVIDTDTAKGQRLARKFELTGDTGLIISSPGGQLQAFSHDGSVAGSELSFRVTRYAADDRSVLRTERVTTLTSAPAVGNPTRTISGPAIPSYQPSYQPSFTPSFAPSPVWSVGGSCPNCRR